MEVQAVLVTVPVVMKSEGRRVGFSSLLEGKGGGRSGRQGVSVLWCGWLPLGLRQWDVLSTFRVVFSPLQTPSQACPECVFSVMVIPNPDTLTLDHIPRVGG